MWIGEISRGLRAGRIGRKCESAKYGYGKNIYGKWPSMIHPSRRWVQTWRPIWRVTNEFTSLHCVVLIEMFRFW